MNDRLNLATRFIDCIFKAQRDEAELARLARDMARADRLSGDSDLVQEYEEALAAHFGSRHAIAVSSGTAALHAALAETIAPGDEVLLPVIGVPMTAAAIIEAGGVPVFYDCQPDSFAPDPASLARYASARSRVLITVPMWGYPGIDDATLAFARERKLLVVEDTAQALGTRQDGRYEGRRGDIGCFSTHEFKLLSTGEGGFILTDNDVHARRMRSFTRIGFSLDPMGFGHRSGLNYKLPAPQASLGMSQLATLERRIAVRNAKSGAWRELLGVGAGAPLRAFGDGTFEHNGYSYAVRLTNATPDRAREVSRKLFELGVNTDIHRYKQGYLVHYPMLRRHYADPRYSGDCRADFPNAAAIIDSLLVLPLHEQLALQDIAIAAQRLSSLL